MRYTANNRKGFTLVEILVVVALTIVILGLVFGPVISSFNFTRRAETMVRAQDNARFALEQVSRELADAMFVYDNTNQPITLGPSGSPMDVPVLYAKVDIVLPRMRGYCTNPGHPAGTRKDWPRHDPNFPELDETSPNCPICGSPLELRPAQPLAADTYIVRYFIGLRDPTLPYSNPYTNRFATGTDNMYVLYRAEFSPYDDRLFANADAEHFQENLRKPDFFYEEPYCRAWRKISRAIVTLENTDLIIQEFDSSGQPLPGPVITPTVKFAPTAIYNDPLVPTTDSDGDPEHGEPLPTVFKASYGYWTTPIEVTLLRGDIAYKAQQPPGGDCVIWKYPPNGSPSAIFNITKYMRTKSAPDPGDGSFMGWRYGVGKIEPVNPEVAFTIDVNKGIVNFAFPVVDIARSEALSSSIGKMAVSKVASTDIINQAYDDALGAYRDRYRALWINDPDTDLRPIAGDPTVVPGSERVVAPDAAPGPNKGRPIRYGRVPTYLYEPGLNQYQLDVNYQAVDTNGNLIPGKTGLASLFFHSYQTSQPGSGVPLPAGTDNVFVYYEIQNNKKGDTLRANYVTKSLMTVTMGIRIYDPTSGKPETVQLTNKVRLRNIAQ